MAAQSEIWTVVIVSDYPNQSCVLEISHDTRIEDLLAIWRDNVDKLADFVFMSVNRDFVYENKCTLREIGETNLGSKLITLRIEEIIFPAKPSREIFVFQNGSCRNINVNSTDKLWKILPGGRKRKYENQGKPLNLKLNVGQAGLQDNMFIYEVGCNISVKLSSGNVCSIAMPDEASVLSLIGEVAKFEKEEFVLRYRGRILNDWEPVKDLRQIVEVMTAEFTVNIGKESYKWKSGSGAIRFSKFISQLSKASNLPTEQLETLNYSCQGCNRTICKFREEFQLIRVKCCELESLKLETKLPFSTEETATQTKTERKDISNRSNALQNKGSSLFLSESAEHEKIATKNIGVQSGDLQNRVTTPVLIVGVQEGLCDRIYLKDELPLPLTAGAIKSEVERYWNWDSKQLEIYRAIGVKKGRKWRKFVQVCNANDEWEKGSEREFSDVSGHCLRENQLHREDSDFEVLLTNDPILICGKRRSVIIAHQRNNPLVPIPLYVRNEKRSGMDFVLTLPRSLATLHLQILIAERLKTYWEELKLFRWEGELPDGRKCVHVCDRDGRFSDGADDDAVFVDAAGKAHPKKSLKKYKRVALVSNEIIRFIPGRRNVISVSEA